MKTYISGKITGLPLRDAFQLFIEAENHLLTSSTAQTKFEPVNVMRIFNKVPGWNWKEYMIADIRILFDCEAIYMIKNWHDSRGAQIEHHIAQVLGLHIFYEEQMCKTNS